MIIIKHNNEVYEVYRETIYRTETLACSDYAAGIPEHVENIMEILTASGVEYRLEEL